MTFNKVVIKNTTQQEENVHLAVHPFKCDKMAMMMGKGDYGTDYFNSGWEMPEYQKKLADQLWEEIPGLHNLFFSNGQITLQHVGLFTDEQIIEAATEIIRPILEQNLLLSDI